MRPSEELGDVPQQDADNFNLNFQSPASRRAWQRQMRSKARLEARGGLSTTTASALGRVPEASPPTTPGGSTADPVEGRDA